jgi:uncharacterized heparinase superfamily protein
MSLALWYHTLRPLRGRQILAQVRTRLGRLVEKPEAFRARPVPAYPGVRMHASGPFLPPAGRSQARADLLAGRFTFLNRPEQVGFPPRWSDPGLPTLWRYNLHYFEYIWDLGFDAARAAALDWTGRHPLARGQTGWEPYPTSLRLVNWCAFFFREHRERTEADAAFRDALWSSIFRQAEWLVRHRETHLLGNHLLENGGALLMAGVCFEGEAARRWERAGRDVLEAELPEQVLGDGGHVERSPMYQLRVAWLLLALRSAGGDALASLLEGPLARLMRALAELRHPDGGIALLNDSAFGIYPAPQALLEAHARASGRPAPGATAPPAAFALPETGYFGAAGRGGDYLVCDAGPIGPDYQPGHAHGDLFSFELSLGGRRVITDSGVHGYDGDPLRAWCRSTRAHNTVEIDGQSQSEFWSVFRVARRARPHDVRFEPREGGFRLSGWHDGYQRLAGRPRHQRAFAWHPRGVLLVKDEVTSRRPVTARSRLHLHPDCVVEDLSGLAVRIRHPGGVFQIRFAGAGGLALEASDYCPEFGARLARTALCFEATGARLAFGFCIANGAEQIEYDLDSGASVSGERVSW